MPPELSGLYPAFHASLLKPYQGPPITADVPKLDLTAGGEPSEFEVEAVLDRRISAGKVQYLIKWKGFDQAENSWEPTVNLVNCRDLVDKFEAQRKQQ